MRLILTLLLLAALAVLLWWVYRKFIRKVKDIGRLPIRDLGFTNMPALPLSIREVAETTLKLAGREQAVQQSKLGLLTEYTIQGRTANAYSFLYGGQSTESRRPFLQQLHDDVQISRLLELKSSPLLANELKTRRTGAEALADPITGFFLEQPEQFALSWTTYGNVQKQASAGLLARWADSLRDADAATEQFFPNLARYGGAYNLLVVQKVTTGNSAGYRQKFQQNWSARMDELAAAGRLYIIDFTCYEMLEVQQVAGFDRFTPATFTWLEQDPDTKQLKPFAIYVAGYQGNGAQFYDRAVTSDSVWLLALQASKVSLTVYGIWYGHVYHWHITTAAMVMTMYDNIPSDHDLYRLLAPQSPYLIGFDDVLLLLWEKIAPPTSIKTAYQFLELTDAFAKDRVFFDDDPTEALRKLNLNAADFTAEGQGDWSAYPIVGYFLQIWAYTGDYVDDFIAHTYASDAAVQADRALQNWIAAAGSEEGGNLRGLPAMDSRANLKRVLHSLLYRIVAHGMSRMENTANPALTFVPNFPPCLQQTLLPQPDSILETKDLLKYLPNTGTIGEMITFYFTFIYSAPYDSLIPIQGADSNLFFPHDNDPRNAALIRFRNQMAQFIDRYTQENAIPNVLPAVGQIHQWPLTIET